MTLKTETAIQKTRYHVVVSMFQQSFQHTTKSHASIKECRYNYNIINQHISVKWQHESYLIHPIPFSCGNHPQFCEIHQAILRLPTLSILSCLYANVNVTATVLMEMLVVTLMYTLKGIAGLHTSHFTHT